MNAKERFYSGLAKETIGKITSNTDNWTSFLRTMSRNYEFTYPEQVMIYAQRPNATFCKPYEDWNAENYRRYSWRCDITAIYPSGVLPWVSTPRQY